MGERPSDCASCEAVRQRAKAEGHRDWRKSFVCYEHAAVDLNSPEMRKLFSVCTEDGIRAACQQMGLPYIAPASADQPDLFGERAA